MQFDAGSTDITVPFRCMSAAGAALTGKAAADLALWYRRGGAVVPITLVDLATAAAAHADGGVYELGDGWYRLDLPDAAVAAGVPAVALGGSVSGGVVLTAPISLASPGVGPYTVTATVKDETNLAIEGARVRLYRAGATDAVGTTNASGVVTLNVEAGTWTVVITADAATFAGASLTVSADVAVPYTMTADEEEETDNTVVVAANSLATRTDIEDHFGETNVETWAALNADASANEITNRINRALTVAHKRLESRIRSCGIYALPLTGSDLTLPIEVEATWAGVWLYENRGVEDVDANGKPVHKFAWHRDNADKMIEAICSGTLVLDAPRAASSHGTNAPLAPRSPRR